MGLFLQSHPATCAAGVICRGAAIASPLQFGSPKCWMPGEIGSLSLSSAFCLLFLPLNSITWRPRKKTSEPFPANALILLRPMFLFTFVTRPDKATTRTTHTHPFCLDLWGGC